VKNLRGGRYLAYHTPILNSGGYVPSIPPGFTPLLQTDLDSFFLQQHKFELNTCELITAERTKLLILWFRFWFLAVINYVQLTMCLQFETGLSFENFGFWFN